MIKFYEITLSRIGREQIINCIGTYQQVNDYAIKESAAIGATYNIILLATYDFNGIKNLGNN